MVNNNKIIVAHVGGRSGSIGFPENKFFSNEINKIIFEADAKSLDQIKEINPGSKILNYFVGKDKEKVILNLNYCPYTSSSYSLNKEFENFYHKAAKNTDYVFKHVMKPKKKINLTSRSLDSLYKDNIIEAPDFLSLDTQGSEYEILLSSKKLLQKNLLAISCEVNFSELYSNTKLFSEIHKLLLANNFILVDLRTFNIGCNRIPSKFRGRGIPLQGEALYFKKPNILKLDNNKRIKSIKLAFIAISFGYTEFAYQIIDQIDFKKKTTCTEYEKFLKIFYNEVRQFKSMPKLWNDVFTFKESLSRFNSALHKNNNKINLLYKILNKITKIIKFDKKDMSFVSFLKKYDFHIAAQEVKSRIEGKL